MLNKKQEVPVWGPEVPRIRHQLDLSLLKHLLKQTASCYKDPK